MLTNSHYRTIFKASPIPGILILIEKSGFKIIEANDAFFSLSKKTEANLIGKDVFSVFPQLTFYNDEKVLKSSFSMVLETGKKHAYPLNQKEFKECKVENIPIHGENKKVEYILHQLIVKPNESQIQSTIDELLEQQEYYRSLFKYHPDAVYSLDLEGRFQSVNETVKHLTELGLNDIINQDYTPLIAPEDIQKVKGHFQKVINGVIQHYNCRIITPRGKSYVLDVTNIPIYVHNKIIGVYGIAKNITKEKENEEIRVKYEQELRLFNKRIYNILESITDGFFTLDKDATVLYWNKEAEKILQLPREQAVGRNFWEIYDKIKTKRFYSEYLRVMKEQSPVHYEEYFPERDIWLEINAYPSEEGITVYFRDITEKKQAEELVRISNERYNYLAKVTNDAIWDWDIMNSSVHRSEGFKTLFGLDLNDITFTTPEHWFDRLHPGDADRVIKSFTEVQKTTDRNQWQEEYRYRKGDNTYAYILDRCFLIRDENGKAIRMIGAMQDITRQKETELQLKSLNEELLARANQLEESNAELERFAYVASHDLKEPLRMITGFLQLLQKKYGPNLDESANTYINYAVEGSGRMQQLIKDLLQYSQVSKEDKKPEEVNLEELMQEVQLNLFRQIEENGATIKILSALPIIIGYRSSLARLFQNLINNAIKFRKPDESPVIAIEIREEETKWLFSIGDNGIGMQETNFERIFEIFGRLHTKQEYPGSGIGLAICKKIVKQHHGDIWAMSKFGSGSTFYFTIAKNIN